MPDPSSPGRNRRGLRRGKQTLEVIVVAERGRRVRVSGLGAWLRCVAPARARGSVTIALVSDARLRALNHKYRRKDSSTDVLSFPANSPLQATSPPQRTRGTQRKKDRLTSVSTVSSVVTSFLGEIVIARGVARRQARAARHSEQTELRVLALHGLLHLLGHDHERDNGRMRRIERRLRRKGGLREGLIERADE